MSTLLSIQSISHETPTQTLFKDLTFSIRQGDRIGLIGHNGSGKSTLMRLLTGQVALQKGSLAFASQCVYAYIEQHLPSDMAKQSLVDALLEKLPSEERLNQAWKAEALLAKLGFSQEQYHQQAGQLSGGQHTRLLLGRALIIEPDLLFLDEPSNHLDLPTLLWLSQFLQNWRGSFVLVSHDQALLDQVCNGTWILRDQSLHYFDLPCSKARQALIEQDVADEHRHGAQQKEIDRIAKSAKRLALWGKVYDNESFAKKAKKMQKQLAHLEAEQTTLGQAYHWQLTLQGQAIAADRVLAFNHASIDSPSGQHLFDTGVWQIKSGDKVALIGANACGKSTLLQKMWQVFSSDAEQSDIRFHPNVKVGYYDQQLARLSNDDSLLEALANFANVDETTCKQALIHAGFAYLRHTQKVASLSGGERARLLFLGLSLGQYELLLLDEPTNHLDMEGKEELALQIAQFSGAIVLVSHDQWLIENSCQRFLFIDSQQLTEYTDVSNVYQRLMGEKLLNTIANSLAYIEEPQAYLNLDEEALLDEWLQLDKKLSADLARKPMHQKPLMQQAWQEKILLIQQQLDELSSK